MGKLSIHPVDIKATLRKRYGSVAAFERARGLAHDSVRDVLRGKTVTAAAEALAVELGASVQCLFPDQLKSRKRDDSNPADRAHRQNAGAR